jgi:hypothetical protein
MPYNRGRISIDPLSPFGRREKVRGREMAMGYRMKFLGVVFLFFGLVGIAFAEEYPLQYFFAKTSSLTGELSQKEREELLNQIGEIMEQVRRVHSELVQALQTGKMEIQYQEGKFWMSKLEQDEGSIENGIQQIKLLKDKPTDLVASIKLYKSFKDLSSNFNAYNNMPSFSALVGDLAPEIELWADPIFYKLYLLPLAQLKDVENVLPPKEKKPIPKGKKP